MVVGRRHECNLSAGPVSMTGARSPGARSVAPEQPLGFPPPWSLTDEWVAVPADDELRRAFAEPDLDERGWEPINVPGHWRSTPPSPAATARALPDLVRPGPGSPPTGDAWLRFDGLFYQGDVWLDGTYLGDTEGYFAPHTFEVTEHAAGPSRAHARRRGDVLAADRPHDQAEHHRRLPALGLLRPGVEPRRHLAAGPRRARPGRSASAGSPPCVEANADRAVLAFSAELDAAAGVDAHIRTTVGAVDHGADHTLATGSNAVEWTVTVDRPRLWWPCAGRASRSSRSRSRSDRATPAGSSVSDRRRFRTGLRRCP